MHAFFVAKGTELGKAFEAGESYAVVPLGAMMEFLGRAGEPVVMEEVTYAPTAEPSRAGKKSFKQRLLDLLRENPDASHSYESVRRVLAGKLSYATWSQATVQLKRKGLIEEVNKHGNTLFYGISKKGRKA